MDTIRNERGESTPDTIEIQRILINYYKELYVNKFENLGEMDKFLEKLIFQKELFCLVFNQTRIN